MRVRRLRKQTRARQRIEPVEAFHSRAVSAFKKENDHVLRQVVLVRALVLGLVGTAACLGASRDKYGNAITSSKLPCSGHTVPGLVWSILPLDDIPDQLWCGGHDGGAPGALALRGDRSSDPCFASAESVTNGMASKYST